jgi:hypothetical protein
MRMGRLVPATAFCASAAAPGAHLPPPSLESPGLLAFAGRKRRVEQWPRGLVVGGLSEEAKTSSPFEKGEEDEIVRIQTVGVCM